MANVQMLLEMEKHIARLQHWSFNFPSADFEIGENIVFFATLPFKGSITTVGSKGIFAVISAIEKQYAERKIEIDTENVQNWVVQFSEQAEEYERVLVMMSDDHLNFVTRTQVLFGEVTLELANEDELLAHLSSDPTP
jgi:hypothetical protein